MASTRSYGVRTSSGPGPIANVRRQNGTSTTPAAVGIGGQAPTTPARIQAATAFSHRRIIPTSLSVPLLCILLPTLYLLLRSILSIVSDGYPIPTACLSFVAVVYAKSLIRKCAPDEERCADALEKCRGRLPLLATLAAGLLFRFIVGPAIRSTSGTTEGVYSDGHADIMSSYMYGQQSSTSAAIWLLTIGLRLAIGTTALSLAVVSRYLGWFSIMRCSSVPLRPNPIDLRISAVKARFSSVDAIMYALTGPDPIRRTAYNNNVGGVPRVYGGPSPAVGCTVLDTGKQSALGGRYMRPPLPIWVPQIFWHATAGAVFANVTVSSLVPDYEESTGLGLLLICALTSILTVLLTVLSDGSSHELKPTQSCSDFVFHTLSIRDTIVSLAVRTSATIQKANLLPYLVLLPLTVSIVLFFVSGRQTPALDYSAVDGSGAIEVLSRTGAAFVAAIVSFFAALFISMYLVLTDTLIRRAIAAPGLDVDRLLNMLPSNTIANGGKGAPFVAEDLIIQSVIDGCDGISGGGHCSSIVQDIAAPRLGRAGSAGSGPAYNAPFDLEEEEVRRNDATIEAVAEAMLPSRLPSIVDAGSLEGDILRVALLEALGGGGAGGGGQGTSEACKVTGTDDDVLDEVQQSLGLPTRYYIALRKRLIASEEAFALKSQSMQQPMIVPLVRALCAYAGGLGEALIRTSAPDSITSTANQAGRQGVVPTSGTQRMTPQRYVLPPGASICAEYAIFGAARLVAMNTKLATQGGGGGGSVRRRHSWLSLLVPAVLHSAHRLRCGVMTYGQSQMDRAGGSSNTDENIGSFIAVSCPDLRRLLTVCNEAAIVILRALMEQDGSRDTEIKVHSTCKTWLNGLR